MDRYRWVLRIAGVLVAFLNLAVPAFAGSDSPQTLYLLRCSGCHGIDGSGSKGGRVPGLPGVNKLLLHPEGRLFLANVPGIENSNLSDGEIAALLNWALDYWGDKSVTDTGPLLTGEEIGRLKRVHVDDLAARGITIRSYSGN
jgi:mono/diheme cytochrome c family protein